jgi:WD repeat and SOF domain-containing protein 1
MEFVSGGWDRTVRIWQFKDGKGAHRPEVYHTKRMQRYGYVYLTPNGR